MPSARVQGIRGRRESTHEADADAFARDLLIPPAHAAALATVADDADEVVAPVGTNDMIKAPPLCAARDDARDRAAI